MVLEGWEIKAMRAGKVQLTDGYVVIRDGELFLIGCRINAAAQRLDPRPARGRPDQEAADAQGRDPPPDRQGRAEGLHAGAAQPALQGRQGQGRDRAGQGQGRARQARHREEARLGAREGPADAAQGARRRRSIDRASARMSNPSEPAHGSRAARAARDRRSARAARPARSSASCCRSTSRTSTAGRALGARVRAGVRVPARRPAHRRRSPTTRRWRGAARPARRLPPHAALGAIAASSASAPASSAPRARPGGGSGGW